MVRDYNRVEYIYMDSRIKGTPTKFYIEMNCNNHPIHAYMNGYEYWLEYDNTGRRIRWRDSDGHKTIYTHDVTGKEVPIAIK